MNIDFPTGSVHFFKGNLDYKYDSNFKRVHSISRVNELLECEVKEGNETVTERR